MATLNDEMEVFWRKFAALIDSGVALLKALNVLAAETSEGRIKEMINKLRKEIASGKTFSDALKNQPEHFPVLVVAMAESGESRGYLEQSALKIANGYKDGLFGSGTGAQAQTVKGGEEKLEDVRKELISFWRKFGKLIDSGIPLLESLSAVEREIADKKFRTAIQDVETMIVSGKDMSQAIAERPEYFPPSVQEMVKAGEVTGTLETYALKIAEALEQGTFDIGQREATEEMSAPEVDKSPQVKLANSILKDAVKSQASDIHIERLENRVRVRYRIDGVLKETASPPTKELQEALVSRIKFMAGMDVAEKRLPQDGRIMIDIAGEKLDLRVSTSPSLFGESLVMRILDKASALVGLEEQGLTDENLKTLEKWYSKPTGIILLAGPAGCGKTTTLYSIIQKLNSESIKISTIEDPIEFTIDGANQMQVNPRIGLTFARILYTVFRHDPDVVMVGEIRDLETAQLEIQLALTGHLVLSTLNTSDASGGVIRLLDMGVEPFLINSSLIGIGIMSQRLVRKVCENCKEEYTPESWVFDSLKMKEKVKLFKGCGCEKCNRTGYRGRSAIHELFELDDASKELISKRVGAEELRKSATEHGLKTMKEDGIEKALKGITTVEEVFRVCG